MPKVRRDLNKKGDKKHLDFTIACKVLRGSQPTPASSLSEEPATSFCLTPNTLVLLVSVSHLPSQIPMNTHSTQPVG